MINKFKGTAFGDTHNVVKRKENKTYEKRLRLDFSA